MLLTGLKKGSDPLAKLGLLYPGAVHATLKFLPLPFAIGRLPNRVANILLAFAYVAGYEASFKGNAVKKIVLGNDGVVEVHANHQGSIAVHLVFDLRLNACITLIL
jgi:hypothetical protein